MTLLVLWLVLGINVDNRFGLVGWVGCVDCSVLDFGFGVGVAFML